MESCNSLVCLCPTEGLLLAKLKIDFFQIPSIKKWRLRNSRRAPHKIWSKPRGLKFRHCQIPTWPFTFTYSGVKNSHYFPMVGDKLINLILMHQFIGFAIEGGMSWPSPNIRTWSTRSQPYHDMKRRTFLAARASGLWKSPERLHASRSSGRGGSRESLGEVNRVSVVANMFLHSEVDVLYTVLFLDCLLMFFVSVVFFHRGWFFLICCMVDDSKSLIETN